MKVQDIQIEDLIGTSTVSVSHDKILQLIKGKTIFVTGGAGSIGSEIVRQLVKYFPKKLVVIDQAETPLTNITLEFENEFPELEFHPVICDIRNKEKLDHLFKIFKPDIIYHCAAYKHVPMMEKNPSEAILVNIMGTKILADLAIKYKVGKFIFISTDKAVNPSSIMGATKRVAEMYLKSLALQKNDKQITKFIITRFGNVLGSNGSVFSLFKNQIKQGGPITITHPDMERYMMSIPEACKLIMEISLMDLGGEIFIFNMGKEVKIIDLAKKMIRLAGLAPEQDIEIKTIGLRPGEKLCEELLNSESVALPTYHNKIMLVKENNDNYDGVLKEVDEIVKVAKEYIASKTVKKIKELVVNYKNIDSTF